MSSALSPLDPSDGAGMTAPEFVRADDGHLLEAVERLVGGGRKRARGFIAHVTERGTPLDELWCALDSRGHVVASALAIVSPGRTAMLYVSPPELGGAGRCAALARHLCDELRRRKVVLAQALLPEQSIAEREVLHGAGFRDLTVLVSMERRLPRRGDVAVGMPDAGVSIEPWDPTDRGTLLRVLDASYEETRDCPGLCGLRRTEDILDGHLHSGRPERTLWSILRIDGDAVGALLLSPGGLESIELVYLGLAPSARRRGLGRLLLRDGLSRLVGRSERTICLAVDIANEPAVRLYRSLDFRDGFRRLALIRPI